MSQSKTPRAITSQSSKLTEFEKRFKEKQRHIIKMEEVQKTINEEYALRRWEWENKYNFNVQDNNPADPEQADWDDIREA